MSDNKNMQLNDEALNSVAGGIGDVINTGSVGGDQTVVDQSTTKTTTKVDQSTKVGGDVTGGNKTEGDKVGGDKTGGNKTDVDTKVDTTVNYTKKGGLF